MTTFLFGQVDPPKTVDLGGVRRPMLAVDSTALTLRVLPVDPLCNSPQAAQASLGAQQDTAAMAPNEKAEKTFPNHKGHPEHEIELKSSWMLISKTHLYLGAVLVFLVGMLSGGGYYYRTSLNFAEPGRHHRGAALERPPHRAGHGRPGLHRQPRRGGPHRQQL